MGGIAELVCALLGPVEAAGRRIGPSHKIEQREAAFAARLPKSERFVALASRPQALPLTRIRVGPRRKSRRLEQRGRGRRPPPPVAQAQRALRECVDGPAIWQHPPGEVARASRRHDRSVRHKRLPRVPLAGPPLGKVAERMEQVEREPRSVHRAVLQRRRLEVRKNGLPQTRPVRRGRRHPPPACGVERQQPDPPPRLMRHRRGPARRHLGLPFRDDRDPVRSEGHRRCLLRPASEETPSRGKIEEEPDRTNLLHAPGPVHLGRPLTRVFCLVLLAGRPIGRSGHHGAQRPVAAACFPRRDIPPERVARHVGEPIAAACENRGSEACGPPGIVDLARGQRLHVAAGAPPPAQLLHGVQVLCGHIEDPTECHLLDRAGRAGEAL